MCQLPSADHRHGENFVIKDGIKLHTPESEFYYAIKSLTIVFANIAEIDYVRLSFVSNHAV